MGTWTTEKLHRLCSIRIGGTPARSNPLYWDTAKNGTNLWASIKDLRNHVVEETEERITNAGVRHSNAKLVKKGTVLLSFKLTIGRVAFAGRDLYTNEAIAALETDQIDQNFLYYGLQHWNLLVGVDQAIKGTTLNKEKLANIEAHLPVSRDEQSKIANILSTVDRAIEQTEALIAKHQRIKTGLMQDLLTRGIDEHDRLRDPAIHRFKPSPLGGVPDCWDVVGLEHALLEIDAGKSPNCPDEPAGPNEWGVLKVSAIEPTGFRPDENKRVLNTNFVNPAYEVKHGDLLFSRSNTYELVGLVCLVRTPPSRLMLCDKTLRLRVQPNRAVTEFIFSVLSSPMARRQIEIYATGSSGSMKNISQKSIKKLTIPLPPVPEQEKICEVIGGSTDQLAALRMTLAKLRRFKTGLMQDLLTGKVSVEPLLET